MRSICLFVSGLLLSSFAFSQASYIDRIGPYPTVPAQEKVKAYLASLDSLQDEVTVKDEKFKDENEAATKNIDQSKMAQYYANYSQNVSITDVQETQKLNMTLQEDNKKLNDLALELNSMKDSIDKAYSRDMEKFNLDYLNFVNKCMGEVGTNTSKCDALLSALDETRTTILDKYYFGKGALYVAYLNAYRAKFSALSLSVTLNTMKLSEKSLLGMVTFPHKEDLAYVELAKAIIGQITTVFAIDGRLWPSK